MLPHQLFGGCGVSPSDGVDNGQMLIDCLGGRSDQTLGGHHLIRNTDDIVGLQDNLIESTDRLPIQKGV
jgi:hypothetical protein